MKTIMIFTAGLFAFSCSNAQQMKDSDVPSKVKEAFAKKYPSVKTVKWEKEDSDFEAEFKMDKHESSAIFDASGNFKEFEQEIEISALPKAAGEYCTAHFAGYKLAEAEKITDASGKITYEAEMSKGKEHFDVIFDDKGNFIKKSTPETGEEDKD